ncbi:MAG: metal-dependent phosphohydrolase [Deltaproteobacteria bacterium HGW-Deltaproteobacteria-10]|nr:MAG: metal-dependent phosphohydrolase [Deltaproteobacteria bacterium HGW-Deltaproteobacteria-10]
MNYLLSSLITELQQCTESHQAQIKRLTEIGTALSAEKDLDRLLEMIVDEARKFTNADAGTLYIMSDDETQLNFAIVQNNSLGIRMGGTGGKITWPPVNLKNSDGSFNKANVSAYVAISGQAVNIPDVYSAAGFNFEGTKKFDQKTGYHSQSMLVVPLRNHENDIIGVLQLLDALDPVTGEIIEFSSEYEEMILSLASQAAIALSNNRLILDLENLLESFIKTIAMAIDEKSPYTGGHVKRVAELTMTMARKINSVNYGKFAGIDFSDNQMQELRIAAWLHDVGKITTPEYVVDKATKLQTVHDRIHDVKTRIELLKKDCLQGTQNNKTDDAAGSAAKEIKALDDDYRFLLEVNQGSEFTNDEMIARIKEIARRKWSAGDSTYPLLSEEEVYNLCIRRGTLTDEERNIINNHALVTQKMLSQLPFPKKMRHIADYAAAHHEKIDGTGYPQGLKGDQLSLQSRIIAIADVFEALTAKDRPYKKGKSIAEALKIMEFMVKDNHIDADLFELFVKEKVYEDYAKEMLVP